MRRALQTRRQAYEGRFYSMHLQPFRLTRTLCILYPYIYLAIEHHISITLAHYRIHFLIAHIPEDAQNRLAAAAA